MNLETRLNDCLNDILRSSGYVFEIISKNKKQSNLITGSNNQLIPPVVTAQLGNSISRFEDILDETIAKFNDTYWCVQQMLESRQKQEELRLKEAERKKEEETKKKEEEQRKLRLEQEQLQRQREEAERQREEQRQKDAASASATAAEASTTAPASATAAAADDKDMFDDFVTTDFDFNMNDLIDTNLDVDANPNPSDILLSIDYEDKKPEKSDKSDKSDKQEVDLDINNILGNNDLILDGLNMGFLDAADEQPSGANEDFDVDNFLNQFGND